MLDTYWTALLDPKDPLLAFRKKGWDRFEELGLPVPREEAFQYLSGLPAFPPLAPLPSSGSSEQAIILTDGFFDETSTVPAPIVCAPLSRAMLSYGLFLQNRIARTLKDETDPFAALNLAFQGGGAFLYLPPKCKADLQLIHRFTNAGFSTPRVHIYLGRGAELKLTQTSTGTNPLSNSFLDIVLDDGARLTLLDHANGHFQSIRASVKRDSYLKAVFLGHQTRNSIKIQLAEENSEAEIFGLARLESNLESHIHALIEHIAPNTRSRQHFKSVLKDKSRFSFEGKILVRPAAQKTQAYQLTNGLILSDEAANFAKPNLEIFADDVKASHGATTGQLDPEQLFYLRSRGLSLAQAKDWLVEGFCKEILDHAR